MNTCSICAKGIKDEQCAVVHAYGYTERETPISCKFAIEGTLWLDHWECHIAEEQKGKWRKLWDALRNLFASI